MEEITMKVKESLATAEFVAKELGIGIVGNVKDHKVILQLAILIATLKE